MKKDLSNIIKNVQNTEIPSFPLDNSELESVLERVDRSESSGHSKPFTNRGIKMTSIITSILMLGIFGINYLSNDPQPATVNKETSKGKKENISIGEKGEKEEERVVRKSDGNSEIVNTVSNSVNSNEFSIFFLNDSELAKLNIIKTSSGFSFITESRYRLDKDYYLESQLTSNGYPEKGIYREKINYDLMNLQKTNVLKYNGWGMSKGSGIYPVSMILFWQKDNGTNGSSSNAGFSPMYSDDSICIYATREILESSSIFKENYFKDNQKFLTSSLNKDEYQLASKLVPIFIKLGDKSTSTFVVLWYVPTKQFLSLLPDNYEGIVKSRYRTTDLITAEGIEFARYHQEEEKENSKFVKNIAGIERLELSRVELEKIGIKYESGKFICLNELKYKLPPNLPEAALKELNRLGYDASLKEGIARSKLVIDTFNVLPEDMHYSGWDMTNFSLISPIAITSVSNSYIYSEKYKMFNHSLSTVDYVFNGTKDFDKIGNIKNPVRMGENNTYRPLIDKLLPVYLLIGDNKTTDSNKLRYAEVNLWFYASREFVELLPDRYRIPIMKELDIISSIEQGNIDIEQACTALKGEISYFDICRINSDKIKEVQISPNPVTNSNAILSFSLTKKTKLKIDLHSFKSGFIKEIKKETTFNEGESKEQLNLENCENGIYMIVITDSNGNQVVKKFIISR